VKVHYVNGASLHIATDCLFLLDIILCLLITILIQRGTMLGVHIVSTVCALMECHSSCHFPIFLWVYLVLFRIGWNL